MNNNALNMYVIFSDRILMTVGLNKNKILNNTYPIAIRIRIIIPGLFKICIPKIKDILVLFFIIGKFN